MGAADRAAAGRYGNRRLCSQHSGTPPAPGHKRGPVKAFLDSSVLIATFYADHEHHEPSLDLFLRFDRKDACCGAHSLAEVYATLTSMPGIWLMFSEVVGFIVENKTGRYRGCQEQ